MIRPAIALLLAAASFQATAATAADTLASFHAALAAGDQARAAATLSPDIVIYESGYAERSRADYVGHHLPADIGFSKNTSRKVLKHVEHVAGNSATVLEETETSGNFGGKPVHLLGLETAVLEKNGEDWLITHLHWSSRKAK